MNFLTDEDRVHALDDKRHLAGERSQLTEEKRRTCASSRDRRWHARTRAMFNLSASASLVYNHTSSLPRYFKLKFSSEE